tara:strand:+ start:1316 stop:1645 length:330 start_codon:yes stop_codon:yes gene_type:complete
MEAYMMNVKFIAIICASAFLVGCSYPLTQMSVDSKSITKPHQVLGTVEVSGWSMPFSDISKGAVLNKLAATAKEMGADDVVDVEIANNCWWAFLLHCQADARGLAIKYE